MEPITLDPPLRRAAEHDAATLAELVNMAGDGLAERVWAEIAERDGGDAWSVGRQRQVDQLATMQGVVVDLGEGAIGCLQGYAIGDAPKPISERTPAPFRPLLRLENQALESWYVNVLALLPEHRGHGWGARLLGLAERFAAARGLSRVSLIVAEHKAAARRLYTRVGYEEMEREPRVGYGMDGDWILMIRTL